MYIDQDHPKDNTAIYNASAMIGKRLDLSTTKHFD